MADPCTPVVTGIRLRKRTYDPITGTLSEPSCEDAANCDDILDGLCGSGSGSGSGSTEFDKDNICTLCVPGPTRWEFTLSGQAEPTQNRTFVLRRNGASLCEWVAIPIRGDAAIGNSPWFMLGTTSNWSLQRLGSGSWVRPNSSWDCLGSNVVSKLGDPSITLSPSSAGPIGSDGCPGRDLTGVPLSGVVVNTGGLTVASIVEVGSYWQVFFSSGSGSCVIFYDDVVGQWTLQEASDTGNRIPASSVSCSPFSLEFDVSSTTTLGGFFGATTLTVFE